MLASFDKKVVLITGAAQGIGKGIAELFGRRGATVAIADRQEEKTGQTVHELRDKGYDAHAILADLRELGMPQKMIREAASRFGGLDVLVNNARAGKRLGMLEEDEQTWDEGVMVNLRAVFFGSQEAVRVMRKKGGGSIINITSVLGFRAGLDYSPNYHATKAAVIHLTRYMALNAGQYGVRVNCVAPGFVVKEEHRTRFKSDENKSYLEIAEFVHPIGTTGTSDDVAEAVMFLASDEAKFITGQQLVVDGGLTLEEQFSLISRWGNKS
jgi:NAD(P)-dependent dehydrogenase (short-subunit alcohol dehydrogenase family)